MESAQPSKRLQFVYLCISNCNAIVLALNEMNRKLLRGEDSKSVSMRHLYSNINTQLSTVAKMLDELLIQFNIRPSPDQSDMYLEHIMYALARLHYISQSPIINDYAGFVIQMCSTVAYYRNHLAGFNNPMQPNFNAFMHRLLTAQETFVRQMSIA